MRILVAFMPLTLLAASALAQPVLDPDEEVARKHFAVGIGYYDAGEYQSALREFRAAYTAKPAPGFQFNIGRCLDRMEQWSEAADAYERYLAGKPDAADAAEVRQRIKALRARGEPPPATVTPPPATVTPPPATVSAPPATVIAPAASEAKSRKPIYKQWWLWTAVGVVVAGAAVGVGVAASTPHDAGAPAGAIPIHFSTASVSP
jgi:tetratricopeptide (TPR) repeat protein